MRSLFLRQACGGKWVRKRPVSAAPAVRYRVRKTSSPTRDPCRLRERVSKGNSRAAGFAEQPTEVDQLDIRAARFAFGNAISIATVQIESVFPIESRCDVCVLWDT
jgi:hypothetical protein